MGLRKGTKPAFGLDLTGKPGTHPLAEAIRLAARALLTTECDPYWDYVRSEANVADLPSRPDLRPELDQILHEMGFEPDQIQTVEPRFPPAGQWSLPSASWIELAKHGMNTRPVQTRDSTRKRRR